MAAGVIIAASIARRRQEDVQAITLASTTWRVLAEELGLEFGLDAKGRPSLVGTLNGVGCGVDLDPDRLEICHTRISAKSLSEHDVTVVLYPNPGGVLGFLQSRVGHDISVGDPAFDQAFLVRAEPASGAPALLGPAVRAHVLNLSTGPLTAFLYENGRVLLQFPTVETSAERIRHALEAVTEAARWSPPSDQAFR